MTTLPLNLLRELRTDHAGETGAVMIYRGVLAISRDADVRKFAIHHLETELRHLTLMEEVVSTRWRSRLLPLWKMAGWLTGAVPALFGSRSVYATIQAVETFVDQHYALQVDMIDALLADTDNQNTHRQVTAQEKTPLQNLRALLVECQMDEVEHREDARARWSGQANVFLRIWVYLVGNGSKKAVGVCRYV
ncbi:demethoxyubiquinone hydroxylase family protein [Polynucleobacter antarcticus]|uniref:Ubiquinone biosynthesis protein COQ7 n=1 Tax=Polynucleobacter antarcticus TaxID=1743162 RepID=A0A6M9PRC5_9BURK|nr:demethoxyubiquinone hydroxylase family protein [Polynucleobacter antarcticus]QKM62432.1 ubiquinone biosynthesis protein COQ7 [Polynucleobacter antarcticus]